MTRILFIGDPHIQVDNISDVETLIRKLTDLANKRKPDYIIIAGDILHNHERVHTLTLNKAYDMIDKLRLIATTYILVGNHDYIQNQQFLTTNHWMNGLKEWSNVKIVDKVVTLYPDQNNKKYFVLLPYVPNGRFIEALDTIGEDNWKNAECIFAHQEFKGCKMGSIISEHGDSWDENNPPVISGHIHSRQKVGTNIYYPGAAMQHAYGESDINIIPYLTFFETLNYKCEEINLNLPRKRIVYIDIDDLNENTINKYIKSADKIKFTVNGCMNNRFKQFKKTNTYKQIVNSGSKIIFKPVIEKQNDESLVKEHSVISQSSFTQLLHHKIKRTNDDYIISAYDDIVNGIDINPRDVMFV